MTAEDAVASLADRGDPRLRAWIQVVLLGCLAAMAAPRGLAEPAPGTSLAAGDLADAGYRTFGGDANADGHPDLLLQAPPSLVVTPGDKSLHVLALGPASPTVAILSRSGGDYSLESAPAQAVIRHPAWVPDTHDLLLGDVTGQGSPALLVRSRTPGGFNAVITRTASGTPRLLQLLTPAAIGLDLGAPDTELALEDRNDDGRADLVIRPAGALPTILLARPDGTFAPDTEGEILSAWLGLCDAWTAGDVNRALEYIDDSLDPVYGPAFRDLGPELAQLPLSLANLRAVEIRDDYAQFVTTHTLDGKSRMHFIGFVRQSGRWVLGSF